MWRMKVGSGRHSLTPSNMLETNQTRHVCLWDLAMVAGVFLNFVESQASPALSPHRHEREEGVADSFIQLSEMKNK